MKKWLKYTLRFFAIGIGLLLFAWLCIYLYFLSNKKSILYKINTLASSSIHGNIAIKDIGINFLSTFPHLAIDLEGISITDSTYSIHHHELLHAEKFLLRTNIFKLISKKLDIANIQVEKGIFYIYEDSTGYNTLDAIKPNNSRSEKDKEESLKKAIHSFRLVDMSITLDKPYKKKRFSFDIEDLDCDINNDPDSLLLHIETKLVIQSLAFNLDKGSFAEKKSLSGDFDLTFNKTLRILSFNNIKLNLDKDPYEFTGLFHFDSTKNYTLSIDALKGNYSKIIALLPGTIRSRLDSIQFAKPIVAKAHITGKLMPGNKAIVRADWIVKNNNLSTKFGKFDKASFTGFYYNQLSDTLPATGENAIVQCNDLSTSYEGIGLNSKKITVTNLKRPFLVCDLQAATDLQTLNNLLASNAIEFDKGSINADIVYSGPVYDSATASPDITGNATIKDGELLYGPKQIRLDDVNGELLFKGADVYFNNVKATAQKSSIILNMSAINLIALMNSNPARAELTATLYARQLDVENFTGLIGTRKRNRNHSRNSFFRNTANKIDRLLDECTIRSHINADKISFKRFTATNFKTDIFLSNELWSITNTSLNHAGGSIYMNGSIHGGSTNYNPVKINAVMNNLDISKTFFAFENFGLKFLNATNIQGRLTSNISLSAAMLEKAVLLPSSLKGNLTLSIKDGALNNVKSLEELSNFLLKNRDFSHITFSEIKNKFDFDGQLINVNRMEIQSSVLSLFVEGLYDMGGKKTDLIVQIPLSNLKKRKADYTPQNKGTDSKAGASVYVKATNKDNGDIDFNYSLFRGKKNKKEKELENK